MKTFTELREKNDAGSFTVSSDGRFVRVYYERSKTPIGKPKWNYEYRDKNGKTQKGDVTDDFLKHKYKKTDMMSLKKHIEDDVARQNNYY